MTENRRIVLNIVATYGRSLYALVCGLFTTRWVLMALGEVDYGLYGVVGGMTIFITFLVGLLSVAVGRFYAFSVGEARIAASAEEGLENCRKWFNTALLIFTTLPILFFVVGYPIVEYGLRHGWLVIPANRLEACVWVFRFLCFSSFVGMVTVPYNAMYTAKQYIAELTIYSFITTTLNVIVLYYMVSHPSVWLTKYAAWMALVSILPNLIIAFRATRLFPECHFNFKYLWSLERLKKLFSFAGWQLFGGLGSVFRAQGIAILVNKYFGPAVNAANTIGFSVATHCDVLAAGMMTAFSPAITNACGEKNLEKVRAMAFRCCKIGTLLTLLFALPLALEINEVLLLWLKAPPHYTSGLSLCVLAMVVIDKTAVGHMLAVNAQGKIALYQAVLGGSFILTLPIAWCFLLLGGNPYVVGYAMIITIFMCACGRVWFARKLTGLSARHSELVFIPLCWIFVLDREERRFVREKGRRQAFGAV